MKQKPSSRRRRSSNKSVLRLPDLEHAKGRGVEQPDYRTLPWLQATNSISRQ